MVQQVNAAAKKELTERINQVGQKSIGEVHPRAFLSASRGRIFHHDQDRFNANVRFNLIHRPLSDLYVVYNEQRVTTPDISVPPGRGLIVKFTEMLAF